MDKSVQNDAPRVAAAGRPQATLPGGFHSRGVPGEEGAVRNRMHVIKVGDRSQRINSSQPLKGATGARQASAARLDKAMREATCTAGAEVDANRAASSSDNEATAIFVIVKKGIDFLDTPVFHAGESGDEEAISLFTSQEQPEQYVAQAGWGETDEIGGLSPSDLRKSLLVANSEGIHYATVNPDRERHLAGEPQPVLFLDAVSEESADSLLSKVTNLAQSPGISSGEK